MVEIEKTYANKGGVANYHHLINRTSPYGEDFIGRCDICGQEGKPEDILKTDCVQTFNDDTFYEFLNTAYPIIR